MWTTFKEHEHYLQGSAIEKYFKPPMKKERKKELRQKTTHFSSIHPLQSSADYSKSHMQTQGVLSLTTRRNESEKMTSPAKTQSHPACVCVSQKERQSQQMFPCTSAVWFTGRESQFAFPQWGQLGSKTDLKRDTLTQHQFSPVPHPLPQIKPLHPTAYFK